MKVFCFVFIGYLVLLLTQPCPDLVATIHDNRDNGVRSVHVENTTQDDAEQEECSPFCICSCCSHPVANHRFSFGVTTEVKTIAVAEIPAEYGDPDRQTFLNSVWQPPKA